MWGRFHDGRSSLAAFVDVCKCCELFIDHRAGKQYYEPYGLAPEAAVEAGLALLLRAKVRWAQLLCGSSLYLNACAHIWRECVILLVRTALLISRQESRQGGKLFIQRVS